MNVFHTSFAIFIEQALKKIVQDLSETETMRTRLHNVKRAHLPIITLPRSSLVFRPCSLAAIPGIRATHQAHVLVTYICNF